MKRTFILLGVGISLIGLPTARGQSTLNATGKTKTIGYNVFDWSVGEISLVSTYYGDNVFLTQGVLQNEIMIRVGVANNNLMPEVRVFPNPASSVVNINYTAANSGTLTYRLLDLAGRVINHRSIDVAQGLTAEQLNIAELAAATYLLELSFNATNGAQESTTFKIEKLK